MLFDIASSLCQCLMLFFIIFYHISYFYHCIYLCLSCGVDQYCSTLFEATGRERIMEAMNMVKEKKMEKARGTPWWRLKKITCATTSQELVISCQVASLLITQNINWKDERTASRRSILFFTPYTVSKLLSRVLESQIFWAAFSLVKVSFPRMCVGNEIRWDPFTCSSSLLQ